MTQEDQQKVKSLILSLFEDLHPSVFKGKQAFEIRINGHEVQLWSEGRNIEVVCSL